MRVFQIILVDNLKKLLFFLLSIFYEENQTISNDKIINLMDKFALECNLKYDMTDRQYKEK